jgi:hypothetical protein
VPEHKRGRLSPAEKKFIADNATILPADAIARKLNRRKETVEGFLRNPSPAPKAPKPPKPKVALPEPPPAVAQFQAVLHTSSAWKRLKDEFDSGELDYFTERYSALMLQFQDDVLATEENQIMQAIKYELLMSRNLIERKKLRKAIERLEKMQATFLSRFKSHADMTETDKADAGNMHNQLSNMRAAEQSKYNEYTTLDKQNQQLLKGLKATREQRLNRATDGKKNFLDFIKMMQDEDVKEREGRQMAHMLAAREKEVGQLGEDHVYQDGTIDRPVLNAQTVEN